MKRKQIHLMAQRAFEFQMPSKLKLRSCTRGAFILSFSFLLRPGFAQDWLQWGGPNGDFTVETKGLAEKWPTDGPRHLWKRLLGDGYSSILYKDDQLFTMYGEDKSEVVIALEARTGGTKWEHRYSREFWPEILSKDTFPF
jgi:hypothetical protein